MKEQHPPSSKNLSLITMIPLVFILLLPVPGPAQTVNEEVTDPVPGLELFDEDTENTQKGWSQLHVSAGFMYMDADGSFSARRPNGDSVTIIDFDRAGLEETDSSYWLSVNWRSARSRWGMWFGSWRYDVVGSRVWGDSLKLPEGGEIPIGASVTSDFDAQWFILEATYSIYRSETVDTGIGLGVHAVDLDTSLTASLQVGDRETEIASGTLDTLAPLPNVLAYVSWKFRPRWLLIARLGYFTLDYNKYSGDMTNAHAMVSYSLSPRWALGASYQFVDLDLEVEQSEYTEVYDIDFAGPMVFARFHF